MLQEFLNYIDNQHLLSPDDSVLIAVSGGIDSVVLLNLFQRLHGEIPAYAELKLGIAHCNFKLRGTESDQEEDFVRQLANHHKIPFYVRHFDTAFFAKEEKVSIQMAARKLRYDWFECIRKENKYRYIAVAHHHNDVIETVLINLIKGSGIAGLHGISSKNNVVLRPLLFASRDDIQAYALEKKLEYKEDSSNASTKYIRNKLRHDVIPILKELNPGLEKTFKENISRIKDVELIFNRYVEEKKKEIISYEENIVRIEIEKLKNEPATLLYEFLKPYRFNAGVVEDIIHSLDHQPGKLFYSDTHRLLKDRKRLLITPVSADTEALEFKIEQYQTTHSEGIHLKMQMLDRISQKEIPTDSSLAFLDADKLKFPLTLRKWQSGDWFHPLGMNTKKKLSDFFIDKKIPLTEKENTWVLISGTDIIWVIGQRIDHCYRLAEETTRIYKIQYSCIVP